MLNDRKYYGLVRAARRCAVLIVLSMCVSYIHVKADIFPLMLLGDAVPNTANFRFTTVSQPVVNSSGTVAFGASFVDPATGATGYGTFEIAGGKLTPVALSGQPLPDAPGSYFGAAFSPSINDAGDIVFLA